MTFSLWSPSSGRSAVHPPCSPSLGAGSAVVKHSAVVACRKRGAEDLIETSWLFHISREGVGTVWRM